MDRAVVNLNDAGVFHQIRGPGLGKKARHQIGLRGVFRAKYLDGGQPIHEFVLGEIDLAHSAFADLLAHFVTAEVTAEYLAGHGAVALVIVRFRKVMGRNIARPRRGG